MFPNDSYTKFIGIVLLVGGVSSASTYAIIRLSTALMNPKQEAENPSTRQEQEALRIKDKQQGFEGLMGVFDYQVDQQQQYFRDQTKGFYNTVGLPNIGNTCYMNSLMQCLAGSQLYIDYIKKLAMTLNFNSEDRDSDITKAAIELLLQLNHGSNEVSPYELYHNLCDSDFTQQSEQQDSHELLIYLQDKITKVTANNLKNHSSDTGLIALSQAAEENLEEQKSLGDSYFSKQISGHLKIQDINLSKSIGKNPFAGLQVSTITCGRCGKDDQIHRWELTYDLNVEVSPYLLDSLNRYFKPEYIDDYLCTKCSVRDFLKKYPKDSSQIGDPHLREAIEFMQKIFHTHDLDDEIFGKNHGHLQDVVKEWSAFKKSTGNSCRLEIDKLYTRITKQVHIVNAPKILCIHLKRIYYDFGGNLSYNSTFCTYPEVLDLQQIANLRSSDYQIEAKYRLSGVIEHFGSAYGGHYVGYRPLFPENQSCNKWVVCDDSRITIISKEQVLQRKAYMLMYQRIQ